MKTVQLLDEIAMGRAIIRIAHEILEKNKGTQDLVLVGIKTRGVPIAKRIAAKIKEFEGVELVVGTLDITLYRDDLSKDQIDPVVQGSHIPHNITNKTVILVDDVLYTGRTARAALDAIMDIGRPTIIQLAVLVDRGHRELPIRADYVGKNVPTAKTEIVKVKLLETDGENTVLLESKE